LYICLSFFSKENFILSRPWQKINSKFVFPVPEGTGVLCFLYLAWLHYVYELSALGGLFFYSSRKLGLQK